MEAPDIFSVLQAKFGEQIVDFLEEGTLNPTVVVKPEAVLKVCEFLSQNEKLQLDSLMNLAGHDQDGESDLSVIYHFYSTIHDHYITVKTFTPREEPSVVSIANLYRTADWHEREAYDMYGIHFEGHPDLKRILLEEDWEGYPLRKDYVPAEFYRGMRIEKVK
ncbi:MAG: NADH-quinone oxidoreductase subunit C [Candidatus Marinimicrobia bacterium]|nr:NADH-quinone oxidoreductase subunit C [Candidatus Neomarinimicrobiota bacterium]MCF7850455.1 NADH-quinone oxidoreductase subunit C [Candidatus Neomarinimicrobiota bacterium]MCF7904967.1 NADH-quinone oxidoreductase subunit C [Candidatus Neomarinimicrobiota bacterium]